MKKRKLLALLLAVSCVSAMGIRAEGEIIPVAKDESGKAYCPSGSAINSYETDGTTPADCVCKANYSKVGVECVRDEVEPEEPADEPTGKSYIVQSGTEIPVLTAGDSLELKVPLQKNDFRASSEVQITATLPEGMYFYEVSDVQTIKFPGGKEKKAELPLKISIGSEMKSGVYPIKLAIDYKYDGGKQKQELDYYVKVEGSTAENGSLVVSSYKVDKENIKAGDTFNLRVNVENKTNKAYKDIKVGIDNLASEGISPYNAMGSVSVPELKAKSSTVVNFSLIASKDVANANQKLDLVITAQGLDEAVHESAFVYVNKNLDTEDNDLISKPKIVINSYDYGGENVVGGTPFTLTISFMNTSSQVSINNLKMTIQSATDDAGAGGVFTPTSSSDSFFVKSIGPNGVVNESIELMPRMDATPKSYGINVTFDYEAIIDGEIVTMNSEEKIAIPVVQSDRFDIGEVEIFGPMYVGQESYVNLSYVNKGKTTINNLEIKVEGENFTSSENNVYVGNVDSGSSDYYSFNLTPMQVGEVKGAFVFTYEDANGSTVEVRKEFSSDAIEMDLGPVEPIDPMIPEEEPSEGMPMWGKVLIGVVVVAGIGAVAYFVIKKKGKATKKIETYDDDDDEE